MNNFNTIVFQTVAAKPLLTICLMQRLFPRLKSIGC